MTRSRRGYILSAGRHQDEPLQPPRPWPRAADPAGKDRPAFLGGASGEAWHPIGNLPDRREREARRIAGAVLVGIFVGAMAGYGAGFVHGARAERMAEVLRTVEGTR